MSDPFAYRLLTPKGANTGSVSDDLFKYIDKECIPLEVTLEITLDCNLKCRHCYNFNRIQKNPKAGDHLSSKEIFRLIDDVYDAGCLNITFTGGEPLTHPGFPKYAAYARAKHMGAYLKTNGVLLTPEMIKKLIQSKIMGIEVSIYGSTAETHDEFTNQPGSLAGSLHGIKNARDAGIPTRMILVLTRHNYREIQGMLNSAHELGIEYGINPQISARYDGTDSSLNNQLTREQLLELYSGPLKNHLPEPDYDPKRSVQCGCARGVCGISSTGDVYPCIGASLSSGNIRNQPFAKIWKSSKKLNRIRNLKLEDFKTCQPCPHRPYCRRSSGFVFTNTGQYTGPDEWTCMEAEVIHSILEGAKEDSQI